MAGVKETRLERLGNAEHIDKKQNISPQYTFHIGASWAAKSESSWRSPYPSDSVIGVWRDLVLAKFGSNSRNGAPGEDFFFIQQMRNQSGISIGVADGVSGWFQYGYDPSLFSQGLMYYASGEIDPTTMDHEGREQVNGQEMSPYECLDLAYNSVLQEKQIEAGSSTACIINLDAASGVLQSANLGDSGYSIIRSNSIFYTSPVQTHFFNCPKQMSKTARGEAFFKDLPSDADTHEVELRDGDIIIVYTDGFSDNVFPSEMVTKISSCAAQTDETEDEQARNMADHLVDYARSCMINSNHVTPFEYEYKKNRPGEPFPGVGKPDDVTVIVGLVRKTS